MPRSLFGALAVALAAAGLMSSCGRGPRSGPPPVANGTEIYVAPGTDINDALNGAGEAPRVIRLGAGDYRVGSPVILETGQSLVGAGPGATRLVAGPRMEVMISNADQEAGDANIALRGLTLDCDGKAEYGAQLIRAGDLAVSDLEVANCLQDGMRISGHGQPTRGATFSNVWVHDNQSVGLIVMWAMRSVQYVNIRATGNGLRGITFDHSEFQASNITACDNAGDGMLLRNLFSSNLTGLYACRNGRHGILATGMISSTGSGWIAQGNSRAAPGEFDELRIMGGDLSYGATRDTYISGISVGAYGAGYGQATARHGVFIADGASPTLEGVSYAETLSESLCDQCAFDEEVP